LRCKGSNRQLEGSGRASHVGSARGQCQPGGKAAKPAAITGQLVSGVAARRLGALHARNKIQKKKRKMAEAVVAA